MARFFVKKTTLSDEGSALLLKGTVVEGPILKGMIVEIPVTEAANIPMRIADIQHYDATKDPTKKVGLVIDFSEEPEAMEIVLGLNIAEEALQVRD